MVLADQETQETRRPVAARQQEASRLGSRRANHAVVHPGGCPVVALVVALVVSAARDGASRRRRALQSRRRQARQGRGDLSRARARDDQERRHFIDRVRAEFDRAALLSVEIVDVGRAMIQERVRAGLARARAEGIQLDRPKVDETTENAIRSALRRKNRPGILKIAKELGVGTSTVQRIAAEFAP